MKIESQTPKIMEQPAPVTPGVTKGMVREHAFRLYRDKLPDHPLTLENWVLAEKDPGGDNGSRTGRLCGLINRLLRFGYLNKDGLWRRGTKPPSAISP